MNPLNLPRPTRDKILVMPQELNEKKLESGLVIPSHVQVEMNLGNPKIATVLAVGPNITSVRAGQNVLIEPHIGLEAVIEMDGEVKTVSFIEEKHLVAVLEDGPQE